VIASEGLRGASEAAESSLRISEVKKSAIIFSKVLTFPPYMNDNIRMKDMINYSLQDLKEELMYINAPVQTEDNWLISANDAMVEKLESKYESNPEEEFYANQ